MNRFYIKAIIVLMIVTGCKETILKNSTSIFDFQSFFDQQVKLLNDAGKSMNKTVIEGDEVYSNIEKFPRWEKELAAFRTFSVIKPGQEGLYDIDTLRSERGFVFITYSANSEKPELQLAEVMFNPSKEVEKITLVVKSEEKIKTSDITLTYLPLKGYDIKGDIQSVIGGRSMIDIHAECLD